MPVCTVIDCGKPARSNASPHCEQHYWRLRRNGSLELPPRKLRRPYLLHKGGYHLIPASAHPLTKSANGYEYEHRIVFYDAHGEGPFSCHVCGTVIGWETMHIDHLNDVPSDNRIENLSPACPTCNQARGRIKMRKAMRDGFGKWIEHDGVRDTLGGWSERLGISRAALSFRLKRWSLERALSEGRGKHGPQARR